MADLMDIGLDKESFGRAKVLARRIMDIISETNPPLNMIEVFTALSLAEGGFLWNEPDDIREQMIKLAVGLIRTSIKTFEFQNDKRPETVN